MIDNHLSKLLRKDLLSFVAKSLKFLQGLELESGSRYVEYVCYILMQFVKGDIKRLLINLPGRHLKTLICSICLPAFMLGLDPRLRFMIVAHDLSLAEDIVRQIREIMSSKWYRRAFKQTRILSGHSQKNDFAIEGGGRVRAVAIGSVTGKGGDIIVFDDPHNVSDWNNPQKKQDVIEQFSTLMTRRDRGINSQMLVTCHRVAHDDLSADILETGKFKHLCLPLFAPKKMEFEIGDETWCLAKGEPLRPDAYPADEIEDIRRQHRGSPFWLHFQQGLGRQADDFQIAAEHFPFFRGRRDGLPVVLSVDPALKTKSTSRNVIHAYAIDGHRYILLDAFAEKCSFKRLKKKVLQFINRYGASAVLVEDTARGPDLIDALRERTEIEIVPFKPQASKLKRLQACAYSIQRGWVLINERSEGAENAVDEIVAYPNCPYDDHVDAMTNLILWASRRPSPVPQSTPLPHSDPPGMAVALYSDRFQRRILMNGGRPTFYSEPPVVVHTSLGPVIVRRT
jgi:predicted phage terminase large subunit-like protein